MRQSDASRFVAACACCTWILKTKALKMAIKHALAASLFELLRFQQGMAHAALDEAK
jgi:hypothetical protein